MSRVCLPACPHRSTSCVPIRSNASHTLHLFVVAGRNVESGTKRSGFRVSHSSHDSHRRIPHLCSIRSRFIVCRRRRAAAIVLSHPPPSLRAVVVGHQQFVCLPACAGQASSQPAGSLHREPATPSACSYLCHVTPGHVHTPGHVLGGAMCQPTSQPVPRMCPYANLKTGRPPKQAMSMSKQDDL